MYQALIENSRSQNFSQLVGQRKLLLGALKRTAEPGIRVVMLACGARGTASTPSRPTNSQSI